MLKFLQVFFQLERHGTTFSTEVHAGLATFLTMSYIIFVNPLILSSTGMDQGAIFTATCLIAAGGTLLSALIANSPIAIAPGMALNTVFAFVIVQNYHFNWQNALGMVFLSGIAFILLTVTKVRSILIKALPECLNISIIAGIAFLIALIALKNNHIIIVDDNKNIGLGSLNTWESLMFGLGFLTIIIFQQLKIPASILLSICLISILELLKNHHQYNGILSFPPALTPTFLKLSFDQLNTIEAYHHIFSFLLIALFDATGTLVGLLHKPNFKNYKNNQKKIERNLLTDSIATTAAALLGSSSTSPFIESATGINAGGRTGLTALVVSICFLLALFFSPIISLIPSYAVGSALLYIACCIMKDIVRLDTTDITNFAPAVLTFTMIPLSFSIADGIGIGIISYTVLKLFTGQYKLLNATMIILSLVFVIYFIN